MTTPTLDYRPASDDRRARSAVALGMLAAALGALGLVAGAMRLRHARALLFGPTFGWLVPPPAWVLPAAYGAAGVALAVSGLLLLGGLVTLAWPRVGRRLLFAYACAKLPLVAFSAACRAITLAVQPDVETSTWLLDAAVECAVFAAVPVVVLVLLRRMR